MPVVLAPTPISASSGYRTERGVAHRAVMDGAPPLRPLDMRRAVLGVLLRAARPLSVVEVVAELQREIPVGISGKRVADVLRFQVSAGRVRRVARGVYQLDPSTMSPSTRWRSLNWQRVQHQWWAALGRGGRG